MDAIEAVRSIGAHLVVSEVGHHVPSVLDLASGTVGALRIGRLIVTGMAGAPSLTRTVRGIIALAHGLGLTAIAPGVDSATQRDRLVDLGCDLGEGPAAAGGP
jgi:EAL domain-containing protein (putative c-di-GMP-specific phosphodiesterase class I)